MECLKIISIVFSVFLLGAVSATPGNNKKIAEVKATTLIKASLGHLEFRDGMLDKETIQNLFDNLHIMREM